MVCIWGKEGAVSPQGLIPSFLRSLEMQETFLVAVEPTCGPGVLPARSLYHLPLVTLCMNGLSSIASMLHAPMRLALESMCFVAYQGDNHAVEVEEEHDEMKAEFDKGFLADGRRLAVVSPTIMSPSSRHVEPGGAGRRQKAHKRNDGDETDLFMDIQFAEYLCRVEKMLVVEDPSVRED